MRWVAFPLERIQLGGSDRVDRRDLVDDQDPAAGSRDARKLGDRELGADFKAYLRTLSL